MNTIDAYEARCILRALDFAIQMIDQELPIVARADVVYARDRLLLFAVGPVAVEPARASESAPC